MENLASEIGYFITIFGAIFSPIGLVLWKAAVWLKPQAEGAIASFRNLLDTHTRDHGLLEKLITANVVQTELISVQQKQLARGRYMILLVDDAPLVRTQLRHICEKVEPNLFPKGVGTLHEAYEWVSCSKLVILDVYMIDCDEKLASAFIDLVAPVPVIVFSEVEAEFPRAAGRMRKSDPPDQQVTTIKTVLEKALV